MANINQLVKKCRKKGIKKCNVKALKGCPQKKGICFKVFQVKTKKPNSAIRKVAKVIILKSKYMPIGYIPGIGHTLEKHATILLRGGRVQDVPGLKFHLVRGKYDFRPVVNRLNARSKYGCKYVARSSSLKYRRLARRVKII